MLTIYFPSCYFFYYRKLKDDLDKQVNETNKNQATTGATAQNGTVCQICNKTKFADGVGHSCNYCQLKSCARCGGRVTLRSNKVSNRKVDGSNHDDSLDYSLPCSEVSRFRSGFGLGKLGLGNTLKP